MTQAKNMRIALNDKTTSQVVEIMEWMGYTNPTHTVNVAIGEVHKRLKLLMEAKKHA